MAGTLASGRNTVVKIYFNGNIWTLPTKTWDVEEVAVEFDDGVNGEIRDRLGKLTKYFKLMMSVYEDGSTNTITNIQTNIANDDAYQPQLPLSGGILFIYNDATKAGFTLGGQTVLTAYKGGS